MVYTVFSVLLGVFEVLGSDVDVDEAEEGKVGNLVDTVVTVVLGESEVENWKVVKVESDVVEAKEDKVGNLVYTVVTVILKLKFQRMLKLR